MADSPLGGFAEGLQGGLGAGARLNANAITAQENGIKSLLSARNLQIEEAKNNQAVKTKDQDKAIKIADEIVSVIKSGLAEGDPSKVAAAQKQIDDMLTPVTPDAPGRPTLTSADVLDINAGRKPGSTAQLLSSLRNLTPGITDKAASAGAVSTATTTAVNSANIAQAPDLNRVEADKRTAVLNAETDTNYKNRDRLSQIEHDKAVATATATGVVQSFINQKTGETRILNTHAADFQKQFDALGQGWIAYNPTVQASSNAGLTNNQQGETAIKLTAAKTGIVNFIRQLATTNTLIEHGGPAAMGGASNVAGALNSVVSFIDGVQQLATSADGKPVDLKSFHDQTGKILEAVTPKSLETRANAILANVQGASKIGGVIKSNLISLAYMQAAMASGQSGRSLSDNDFDAALKQLAAAVTPGGQADPKVASAVLLNAGKEAVANFRTFWGNNAALVKDDTFPKGTPDVYGEAAPGSGQTADQLRGLFGEAPPASGPIKMNPKTGEKVQFNGTAWVPVP